MRSLPDYKLGYYTSFVPGLFGCLVLYGWKAELHALIQVIPGAAPMQFNTALGFILVSVFLFLLWIDRKTWMFIPSGLLALLGGLTLSQYIFGFDLGIDELLHSHQILDKTSHPGRMAPNTAVCFFLIGAIGALIGSRNPIFRRPILTIAGTAALIALSLSALLGYLVVQDGTYDWFSLTQMAIHTTIGFIIAGGSLVLFFRQHPELGVWPEANLWPWIMGGFLILVIASSYSGLIRSENQLIINKIDSEQTIFTERLELIEQFEERAFERLADRWAHYSEGSVRRDQEARAYLRDFSGLRRIIWLPLAEGAIPRQYSVAETSVSGDPEELLELLPSSGGSGIPAEETRVLRLYESGDDLMAQVYLPVMSGEVISGYLLFTKNMSKSFGAKTLVWLRNYLIEIRSEQATFFYNTPDTELAGEEWRFEKKLSFFGTDYTIVFLPAASVIEEMRSNVPGLMLGVGLLISVLSCIVLHQRNVSVKQLAQAEIQRDELAKTREQEAAARNRLQLATAAGDIGTWEWDIATNELIWDKEMKVLYGFDVDEHNLTYDDWIKAVHPDDRELASGAVQKATEGMDEYTCTFRINVPDKGIRHIDAQGLAQRNEAGKPLKMYGINRDVTERIEYEEKLNELNERLLASNKELEHFAYIASHDLQEPLRKITAFGERLMERARDDLQEQHRTYLDRMVNAGHRMSQLIAALLSYSRVESKSETSRLFDLKKLIDLAIENLESAIESSQASIEVGDMPSLVVDSSQIIQLFQNLISNAIKFQRTGQKPEIRISATLDSTLMKESSWQIRVSDNGIGIEKKYHEKVFGIFERLHAKTSYSGSGIGLAICHKIVARHRGTLTVESDPNVAQGTTFIISLPTMAQTSDPAEDTPLKYVTS